MRIFMCPGGAALGVMDLARAREQFDIDVAQRFRALADAEAACKHSVGFLLEVIGSEPAEAASAVLFVRTLRA